MKTLRKQKLRVATPFSSQGSKPSKKNASTTVKSEVEHSPKSLSFTTFLLIKEKNHKKQLFEGRAFHCKVLLLALLKNPSYHDMIAFPRIYQKIHIAQDFQTQRSQILFKDHHACSGLASCWNEAWSL